MAETVTEKPAPVAPVDADPVDDAQEIDSLLGGAPEPAAKTVEDSPAQPEPRVEREAEPKPEPAPAPAPAVDSELLERAKAIGLTPARAQALAQRGELGDWMDDFYATMAVKGRAASGAPAGAPPPAQAGPATPAPQPQGSDADKFAFEFPEDENYDPKLVKQLKAFQEREDRRFQALREQHEKFVASMRERDVQSFERAWHQEFDTAVGSLGQEYAELVGAGDIRALNPVSAEVKNRVAIRDHVRATIAGLAQFEKPIPPMETLVRATVRALFADKHDDIVRKKALSEAAKARGRAVAPPTRRTPAPQKETGKDAALRAMREWEAAHGVDLTAEIEDDLAALPA